MTTRILAAPRKVQKTQQSVRLLAAAAILLAWLPASASAAPITFNFNGTATFVNSLVSSQYAIGNSLTGSLTYDSALVDADASATHGLYAPLSSLTFTLNGNVHTFVSGTGFDNIDVQNGSPDQLVFRADVTGPTVNGFKPFFLTLSLADPTGLALNSDALPTSFNTIQFSQASFIVSFTNRTNPHDLTSGGTNFTGVSGTLTSGVAVPEPSTLTMLGSGLVGMALWLRRKRSARGGDPARPALRSPMRSSRTRR